MNRRSRKNPASYREEKGGSSGREDPIRKVLSPKEGCLSSHSPALPGVEAEREGHTAKGTDVPWRHTAYIQEKIRA